MTDILKLYKSLTQIFASRRFNSKLPQSERYQDLKMSAKYFRATYLNIHWAIERCVDIWKDIRVKNLTE